MYKIKRAHVYLLIFAALILQAGVLNHLEILGSKPDLMTALVIFFGLFLGSGMGLGSGLLAGFLKDIFALDYFWMNTFTLGLTGLVVGAISAKFFKESKRAEFIIALVFTAFFMSLHYFFTLLFSKYLAIGYREYFFSSIIPGSIYTGLLSIPLYALLINSYNLKEVDDFI
ncbi:MAG: rod shape-determining protein MreD [Candidatus Omnitrophota bacterium]